MFFDPRKYDFSALPLEVQHQDGLDTPLDKGTLDAPDFVSAIKYLFKLRKNIGVVDDIDHLRQPRAFARLGELLENQIPHRLGPYGARPSGKMDACIRKCPRPCRQTW